MITVVQSGSVSHGTPGALSEASSSSSTSLDSLSPTPGCNYYRIEDIQQSECALVLFTQHALTSECLVIKVLREYKDTRYSLETMGKRQQCQLEALRQNRVFTPEVYIGLACIDALDLDQKSICIDKIIKNPTQEMLDPGAEYALIMQQLPEDRRLDYLLKEKEDAILRSHVLLLATYAAYMHKHLVVSVPSEDGVQCGSYKQLQKKLLHNFGLLDLVLTMSINDHGDTYNQLEDRLSRLKKTLYQIFTQSYYKHYFEQRVAESRIKHCHGDLKAPNIWIASQDHWTGQEVWKKVSILDAVDFNQSYMNIDVLSDLALLVVDIQTRTQSSLLADLLTENYLKYTDQQDEASRAVLAYYLVEKAIVGAAISIVYDNLPDLGWAFLETAEMRLKCLENMEPRSLLLSV